MTVAMSTSVTIIAYVLISFTVSRIITMLLDAFPANTRA